MNERYQMVLHLQWTRKNLGIIHGQRMKIYLFFHTVDGHSNTARSVIKEDTSGIFYELKKTIDSL